MRHSQLFAPTLRDIPAEAEVISHQLLLRSGFIRRVTSGVYDYLPLGLRVLRKIENIVREEMNRAGAQELLMPMVQPAELWQKSGRWEKYGRELLRVTDRHNHISCLGPTHEEVICDLMQRELRSYRQLPVNLYQIQSKFRDEVRPRFGLMRGREFIMKDAYSFHADDTDLAREYRNMFDTYTRIFTRLGLKFRAVQADTGSIGGSNSHEFHVLANSGEDEIAHCSACDYAANVEMAKGKRSQPDGDITRLTEVSTPGLRSVNAVSNHLGHPPAIFVKTMLYRVTGGTEDRSVVAVCLRGDDQIHELKLLRALQAEAVCLASEEEVTALGSATGFAGPQGLGAKILADHTLKGAAGLIAGANKRGFHVTGLDMERDVQQATYLDLRRVRATDSCPECGGDIELNRGIEVGHIFALGRCYSEPMEVVFQDNKGKRAVATMGCYGIGISRLLAAVVEQCHDDAGIIWPLQLAPFTVALISIGKSDAVKQASEEIYGQLKDTKIEVLWDDRQERPGVKFRDAELMGLPVSVVVGERSLANGEVEYQLRGNPPVKIPLPEVESYIQSLIREIA